MIDNTYEFKGHDKAYAMLINDHFQNFKPYHIPHAQLIIADVPYNIGKNAYASNPVWYKDGDNKNGESELAGKEFFDTDKNFRPAEFMHFCSQMLIKEPKNGITEAALDEAENLLKSDSNKECDSAPIKNRGGESRVKLLAWCCSAPSSSCTTSSN